MPSDPQSYQNEVKQLEQVIMTHVPKAVHLLLNAPAVFIEKAPTQAHIIQDAVQYLTQSHPEIHALVNAFNQKHPNQPYDPAAFGAAHNQAAPKQAITTQFSHSLEAKPVEVIKAPSAAVEADEISKSPTLKHR